MKRHEDALQRAIIEYLRLVLPASDYRVFAIPNGGARTAAEAGILKATGVLAGVPDVEILGPLGRSWRIEVKTPEGRLSPAQEAFRAWMVPIGVPYVVARTIDDVKAALTHWRIPTRDVDLRSREPAEVRA